ncbi:MULTISPECIES: phage holin family protein [unclassified Frankia]|uniref:phage holin family protein n=2 Tax=Frankia TaxID=1854 RepID=UPI001EF620E3|nr:MULTISPECIES: phage holin family protein [unclassified Frankia]
MSTPTQDRSAGRDATLGELVAVAARDLSLLVRQEIDLAKAELSKQAMSAALGVGFLVAAAGLGLGALIAVTIGFGELFTWAGVERFWAYFLTTLLYLVVAGMLALFGATRLKKVSPPERTLRTVKEDIAWLKHPTTVAGGAANHSNGHVPGSARNSVSSH